MTAKKASPAKKADPDSTAGRVPKKGDKPDDAGSADPASKSIARQPKGDE